MQHDIYSWNIDRTDFIYVDSLSKESSLLSENIKLWLSSVSVEERKEFIDLLFTTISSINPDIKEILTNWQQSISLLIKSSKEPVIKDMLQKSIKIFLESGLKK